MRLRAVIVVALAIAVAALATAPAQAAKHKSSSKRYYLALGDSLSVGVQPNSAGVSLETNQGYANQLLALERKSGKKNKNLKLYDLGCGGESTGSMLGTSADVHCQYKGDRRLGYSSVRMGSQIAAAEKFLKKHRKQVAFVTIDIGANDVDGCAKNNQVDLNCLNAGIASIKQNIPIISSRLRAAAGRKIRILGMNLYDPFLELYFDPNTRPLATASVDLARSVNQSISDGFLGGGLNGVADVFTAFQTGDTTPVPFNGQQVPRNVVQICVLTWMCVPRPVGPNIHANQMGYGVIAATFKALL